MSTEMLNLVCDKISALLDKRKDLIESKAAIEAQMKLVDQHLASNTDELKASIKERDCLTSALSEDFEEEPPKEESELTVQHRQSVISAMKQCSNNWIMPSGVAALTGLAADEVNAILRRISKTHAIPVEHNNMRGRGSMYRWVGEKE